MHHHALVLSLLLGACGTPPPSDQPASDQPASDQPASDQAGQPTGQTRIELVASHVDRPVGDGTQRVLAGLRVRIGGQDHGGLSASGTCTPSALPSERGIAGAIAPVICTGDVARQEIWFTSAEGGAVAHVQSFALDPNAPPGPVTHRSYLANGEPQTVTLEGVTLDAAATVEVVPED